MILDVISTEKTENTEQDIFEPGDSRHGARRRVLDKITRLTGCSERGRRG
jgi:hypothetical protein